jgi:hypothetical protein
VTPRSIATSISLLLVCSIAPVRDTVAVTPAGKPAFSFQGVEYFHRWSKADQHEFTPAGQEDLKKWTDMITLNAYSDARDGDALAAKANAVLENYTRNKARVLKTNSVPRTANKEAEHLIAVVFGRPEFIEVAFARFEDDRWPGLLDRLFASHLRREDRRPDERMAERERDES